MSLSCSTGSKWALQQSSGLFEKKPLDSLYVADQPSILNSVLEHPVVVITATITSLIEMKAIGSCFKLLIISASRVIDFELVSRTSAIWGPEKIQGEKHQAEMHGEVKKDKEERALLIKKRLEKARLKVAQPVERDILGAEPQEEQEESGEGDE